MLNTDLHLAVKLGMSEAVYLLHLYAFMAWTGTYLPFLHPPAIILEIFVPAFVYWYIRSVAFQSFLRLVSSFLPIFLFPFLFMPPFLSFHLIVHSFFFVSPFFLGGGGRSSGSFPSAFCPYLTFNRRIKSRLPFAGIVRSSPYSPRFQDKG